VRLAKDLGKKVAFIATAVCLDEEMKRRVQLHRNLRPGHWKLIEEDKNINAVLCKLKRKYRVVLIDCLGLLISNFMADNLSDTEITKRINKLLDIVFESRFTVILVSNETGMSIVPNNPLARRFRDILGLANQAIAKKADEVFFMCAGIPVKIKGESYAEIK
jgi:adenosylcobinamide kinase/adenosylcobinamide-phosphate guanylyltransferase